MQGALNFLIASKDPQGNWGYSTQATVLTLKALIASLSAGAPNTAATVVVKLNGEPVAQRGAWCGWTGATATGGCTLERSDRRQDATRPIATSPQWRPFRLTVEAVARGTSRDSTR